MKRLFCILLLTTVSVGGVSIGKSGDLTSSEKPGNDRKSKLFYNFWIPLPGGPTQPAGTTPVAGEFCNASTIITAPCSCGGHPCAAGRTCIDPGTTMTCTTPTTCMNMVISTAVACTCGTGPAAEICTTGQFCNANAAMNRCTRFPDCVETSRYSMEMPCRCGIGTNVCGLTAPANDGEVCTIGTGQCRTPTACVTPFDVPRTIPCLCSTGNNIVPCPIGAMCTGVAADSVCNIRVPPTPPPPPTIG